MIVNPTANLWVELIDQIGGRHAMCVFDDLSEEIKAVLHVRNDRLCRREFKTSFLQKALDQGLDFSFQ